MVRNTKTTIATLFSLLLAVVLSFTIFTAPVSAEDSEDEVPEGPVTLYLKSLEASGATESSDGTGVHADPTTFEKNFCLSVDQKEYAITEIEKAVSENLKPEMSDLEKYYRLAIWENKRASYDWEFWDGSYNFDLYRHQWDSYGVLTEKSVCVGMAITYAVLCHAADLPCKFVRTDPKVVDHTVSYIPDINGNAYCVDVTENAFVMSKYSDNYFVIDEAFAEITKECTDGSFEYHKTYEFEDEEEPYVAIVATNIKDCYDKTYDEWFKEYALHEDTDKDFRTPYVERGSGTKGVHYASYQNFAKYPAQTYASRSTGATGIWFLDDFYQDPEDAQSKILNGEFDEQFLDISGIKEKYNCKTIDELLAAIGSDISIRYFPTAENGKVVAKAAELTNGVDFTLTYHGYDEETGEAIISIEGIGEYTGSYLVRAKVSPEPVAVTYENVSGEGNVWYKGSKDTSDFTFGRSIDDAATIEHFTGILVDDEAVDVANYTAESGSVIIKLKPEYLETLPLGEHTLTAQFDDGNAGATAAFTIAEKEKPANNNDNNNNESNKAKGGNSAETGDDSHILPWIALMTLSLLAIVSIVVLGRRKKVNKN